MLGRDIKIGGEHLIGNGLYDFGTVLQHRLVTFKGRTVDDGQLSLAYAYLGSSQGKHPPGKFTGQQAGAVDRNSGRMSALESFVRVQSDAALRQVAGNYAYDTLGSEPADTLTLRNGGDTINHELVEKLNERLEMAGISVLEARINYLAYAPEIAAVMLRRQQAEAIISAREKIVEGAVSMVQMALKEINEKDIVELDEAKKAAMVSNLLVVLCADESAQPVLNTGSLYQ